MRCVRRVAIGFAVVLTAAGRAAVAQSCPGDPFEQDDACTLSRTMIEGGAFQTHDFCDDAADWLSMNVCAGRSYTIETSGLGSSADTVLELYAGDCSTLLASDDDGAGGRASRIVWSASGDGVVHVRVRQKDGTTGVNRDYEVAVSGDTSTCATWIRWYAEDVGGPVPDDRHVEAGLAAPDGGSFLSGYRDDLTGSKAWVGRTAPYGTVLWARRIETNNLQFNASIAPSSDGGFLYLDEIAVPNGAFGTWVARFSSSGALVWQKQFGGGSSTDIAYQIAATSGGGFVLAGETDGFGSGADTQPWIVKADGNGTVQWSIRLQYSDDDVATAVTPLRDGGVLVAGNYFDATAGTYDIWVERLDASGTIVWQEKFGGTGDDANVGSLIENPDGSLLVAAKSESFSPVAGTAAVWILDLSSAGAVQWQRSYWASPGSQVFYGPPRMSRTPDGGIQVGVWLNGGSPQGSWIFRIDPSGSPLWQSVRDEIGGGVAMRGLSAMPDGGTLVFDDGPTAGAIRRVDASGSVASCSPVSPAPGFTQITTTAAVSTTSTSRKTYNVSVAATAFGATSLPFADEARCPCSAPPEGLFQYVEFETLNQEWHWNFGPTGLYFDMVRGELDTLRSTGGDFTAALNAVPADQSVCWFENTLTTDVRESDIPLPDSGFFLLLRPTAVCRDRGGYNGTDPRQIGARDAEINAAARACP